MRHAPLIITIRGKYKASKVFQGYLFCHFLIVISEYPLLNCKIEVGFICFHNMLNCYFTSLLEEEHQAMLALCLTGGSR